jgi:hypothetical protein
MEQLRILSGLGFEVLIGYHDNIILIQIKRHLS